MKHTRISILLAIVLLLQLCVPLTANAADFTPNPQTEYAKQFIAACDGQTWFINEIERLLNAQQRTLDTITGSEDLVEIKSIGLKGRNITGHIPAAIGELSGLRYLFLSDNHLSGEIPSALYALPDLQNVDLGGNDYAGAVPSEFGTMPALKTLILKGNRYTGTIPDTILSNTRIEVLNLMGNQLTGGFPAGVAGMSSLKYLNLSENAIGGTIPDLSALTNLISLSAWQCGLTGTIPETLYSLSGLQILDLSENKLEGEISAGIASLTELQYLALDTNPLRGVLPDAFTQAALTEIHLENTYLRGLVPATLKARHDAGVKVYLNNNYMTGTVLKDMPNNSGNFADGAASEQYQLTSNRSTVTVSKDGTVNLYALLLNKSLTTGSTAKVLLKPDEYVVSFDDTKVQVTSDGSGIYVKALTDIPLNTNFSITIQIKDNTGSEYSKVKLTLTTDVTSGGGGISGGGGGTTETPKAEHKLYINGFTDGMFHQNNIDGIKEIFSITAQNSGISNAAVQQMIDLFCKKVVSVERLGGGESEENNYGELTKSYSYSFSVKTECSEYLLILAGYTDDANNAQNIGVSHVVIMPHARSSNWTLLLYSPPPRSHIPLRYIST